MTLAKVFLAEPEQKLLLGLLFIPAYLLQTSILIRALQFILIIIIYLLYGGKFKILPNLILFTGIIFAYILIPTGKVFFLVGNFPVTQGSLISGLTRAFMLIGLIYVSRLSVSSKLNFKGRAGKLIGRVFYYFEAIIEEQGNFSFKNFYKPGEGQRFIRYIDNLLFSMETNRYTKEIKNENEKNNLSKFVSILIFTFIFVSYLLLLPITY